jgi:hypothetical protein
MIEIAHRGNTAEKKRNNNPSLFMDLMDRKTHIEIDLWVTPLGFALGHDGPEHEIGEKFLTYPNFWIHAKNLAALLYLTKTDFNYFWHENDQFTLTSQNVIWTYPKGSASNNSIIVCTTQKDHNYYLQTTALGICSDFGCLF